MLVRSLNRVLLVLALVGFAHAPAPDASPTAPEQPHSGPGGRSYPHRDVRTTRLGTGAREVYVFEPATPTPTRAPVVVFGHGWAATNPDHYAAWIVHIVRRGNTVIYPRYQATLRTPVAEFTVHAVAATARGLEFLRRPGRVAPDPRGLALVGHSMGGLVMTNVALQAARGDLPPPIALMVVAPGRTWPEGSPIAFPLGDVAGLPPGLLLLALVGDDDDFVGETDARKIYAGAARVEPLNRNFVRMFSDPHGAPALVADHRFAAAPLRGSVSDSRMDPLEPGEVGDRLTAAFVSPDRRDPLAPGSRGPVVTDSLDFYGTWKLWDGLVDAAFRGTHREFALGDTPAQRYMGHWSDRVPVRELIIERP